MDNTTMPPPPPSDSTPLPPPPPPPSNLTESLNGTQVHTNGSADYTMPPPPPPQEYEDGNEFDLVIDDSNGTLILDDGLYFQGPPHDMHENYEPMFHDFMLTELEEVQLEKALVDNFLSNGTLVAEFIDKHDNHNVTYWDGVLVEYLELNSTVKLEDGEEAYITTFKAFIKGIEVTEQEIFWIVMHCMMNKGKDTGLGFMGHGFPGDDFYYPGDYNGQHYNWTGYGNETHHGYFDHPDWSDDHTYMNSDYGDYYGYNWTQTGGMHDYQYWGSSGDDNDYYDHYPYDYHHGYNGYSDDDYNHSKPNHHHSDDQHHNWGSDKGPVFFKGYDKSKRYYGEGEVNFDQYGTLFHLKDLYYSELGFQDAKFYPWDESKGEF